MISEWLTGGSPAIVLVGDDESRLDRYEAWLVPVATVERMETLPQTITSLSQRLAIVLIDSSVSTAAIPVFKDRLTDIRPWCRLLWTDHEATDRPAEADAVLPPDSDRNTFEKTVQQLLDQAVFSAALHEFFRIQAQLVELSAVDGGMTAPDRERLERLQGTIRALLPGFRDRLDIRRFEAMAQAARIRTLYLSPEAPRSRAVRTGTSKYVPDRCPSCKEPWEHALAKSAIGYVPLAAFVFRCLQCGSVHNSRPSGYQKVSR